MRSPKYDVSDDEIHVNGIARVWDYLVHMNDSHNKRQAHVILTTHAFFATINAHLNCNVFDKTNRYSRKNIYFLTSPRVPVHLKRKGENIRFLPEKG